MKMKHTLQGMMEQGLRLGQEVDLMAQWEILNILKSIQQRVTTCKRDELFCL